MGLLQTLSFTAYAVLLREIQGPHLFLETGHRQMDKCMKKDTDGHTHMLQMLLKVSPPPQGKIALRQKSLPRGKELGSWGDAGNAS